MNNDNNELKSEKERIEKLNKMVADIKDIIANNIVGLATTDILGTLEGIKLSFYSDVFMESRGRL